MVRGHFSLASKFRMMYNRGGSHSPKESAKVGKPNPQVSSQTFIRDKGEHRFMATTLKPLGDRIVVKALAGEAMTPSGIVLPDTV
jgi:hypothetical protein